MKANVYDFDKTIYDGDSTAHFYFHCLKCHPQIAILLPYQGFFFFLFVLHIISKTQFKEKLYTFLRFIKDIDAEVERFWEINHKGIKKWYLGHQDENDIIISASPEFLLKPICRRLNIKYLFASVVDSKTGKYTGINCWGDEKVRRLKKEMPEVEMQEFYSDSYCDQPLARIAKKSFMVTGEELSDWIFK